MLCCGNVAVDQGVVRITIEVRTRIDKHVDECDLDSTLASDPRPGHEGQRNVKLFLEVSCGLPSCMVNQRACHLRNVLREPPVTNGVFSHEPEQVRSLKEPRSEEHTSELQSQSNLVCRLLLEKKKNNRKLSTTSARNISIDRHRYRAVAVRLSI